METQLQINKEHLYRLAKEGKSAREIMNETGVDDMYAVKNALTELMREKNEDFQVPGLVDEASISPRYTNEGIHINSKMLADCDFKPGDQFRLKVEGDKITLDRRH